MKKVVMLLVAMMLLTISCEKEQTLAEFVIGDWESQEIVLGDSPFGTFTASIMTNDTYTLTFTLNDGSASLSCPPTKYWIDNEKSQIIITEPDFDTDDNQPPPTGTVIFDVLWTQEGNTMDWTPVDSDNNDAPVLNWTRK